MHKDVVVHNLNKLPAEMRLVMSQQYTLSDILTRFLNFNPLFSSVKPIWAPDKKAIQNHMQNRFRKDVWHKNFGSESSYTLIPDCLSGTSKKRKKEGVQNLVSRSL